MHRIALLAAFAALSFAQTPADTPGKSPAEPPKPPAGVDEALRARITEFYQYHVTDEFRKAEKLVAEESQDIYYVASKPHYLGFEIKNITYSDNFTKAKVNVLCDQYFHGLGFEGKPVKAPSTSTWKVVDGKWFWYVDPDELAKGPFGKMANAGSKPGAGAPVEPPKIPTSFEFVLDKVKFEKPFLVLKPGETQTVKISSDSPGTVTLVLAQVLPGIETTIDKPSLKTGEKAVVTLKAGDNPNAGFIGFHVEPTGELVSIEIKRK
jgi:hypothetical protein